MGIHLTYVRLKQRNCCAYIVPKEKSFEVISLKAFLILWCGAGLNRRHKDFQSFALPTELPHH